MNHIQYNTHEKPPLSQWIPLSIQHVFAMFGGTILVPLLTGLSTTAALFTAGTGTLIYIAVTRGKVPTFLGSSFTFIAPLTYYIVTQKAEFGVEYAMGGVLCSGLFYCVVAGIVKLAGYGWINKVFPPVVAGCVIITIGLTLAPNAVAMALKTEAGEYSLVNASIVAVTLFATIFSTVLGNKLFSALPVLIGLLAGYLFTALMATLFVPYRMISFETVKAAEWFALPHFAGIKFSPVVAVSFIVVSLATICEHIGDTLVVSKVVGKNFMKDPGLHSTLLGDGLATMWASLWGGPPNTTYGENVGVLAITRVYSVWVIAGTAVFAIVLSLLAKVGELIHTIPDPVMGGVCIVLFGFIAISGARTLVDNRVDFTNKRNLMIGAIILSIGLGGAKLVVPLAGAGPDMAFELGSVSVATLTGIILNLVLPNRG